MAQLDPRTRLAELDPQARLARRIDAHRELVAQRHDAVQCRWGAAMSLTILARTLYSAYCASVPRGRSDGKPLLCWDALTGAQRRRWERVAGAATTLCVETSQRPAGESMPAGVPPRRPAKPRPPAETPAKSHLTPLCPTRPCRVNPQ